MTQTDQDHNWAAITPATRAEAREAYRSSSNDEFEEGFNAALRANYGPHNLSSYAEPEGEAFIIPVEQVRETYAYNEQILKYDPTHKGAQMLKSYLLRTFGDKCLPDKEPIKIDAADSLIAMAKDEMVIAGEQSSLQVETKFCKGNKVRFKDSYYKEELHGRVGIITFVNAETQCFVEVDNTIYCSRESDLEPYTEESETKRNETQNLSLLDEQSTEAKELDLCDLLKGCEGAEIFLPDEGKCTIHKVTHTQVILTRGTRTIHLCDESLLIAPTGFAYAYPSKESFLANPLNAKAAWMEWKEARAPKRWRAETTEDSYYYLDDEFNTYECLDEKDTWDNKRYAVYNYFRTEEDANRAAGLIRETLIKFHEQNADK